MQIHTIKFKDYLMNYDKEKLHPKLSKIVDNMSQNISELNNIILYGPPGIGKYTMALRIIRNFSESKLKYEKKISVTSNNEKYFIKISDIHYEVDCSLLGCNSKILWNDIYKNIIDVVLTKPNRTGIILCKNFHEITNDMLDIFQSYMQTLLTQPVNIKFIIITEGVSFIPNNIINCYQIINMKRPAKTTYNKCIKKKLDNNIDLSNIKNMKTLQMTNNIEAISHVPICNTIINNIIDIKHTTISKLRENLYNLLIYNLNIYDCVWYIINNLCKQKYIKNEVLHILLVETYKFFLHFNNNYRPIYHLENYVIYIINTIHEYGGSM